MMTGQILAGQSTDGSGKIPAADPVTTDPACGATACVRDRGVAHDQRSQRRIAANGLGCRLATRRDDCKRLGETAVELPVLLSIFWPGLAYGWTAPAHANSPSAWRKPIVKARPAVPG